MTPRQQIQEKGFFIARQILTDDDVSRLSHSLSEHFKHTWTRVGLGKHQPNASVAIPSIEWVFTHPKILATLRELFNSENVIFTKNCDAHMNMLSWWHKDTSEGKGGCFTGDYFNRRECRVYRAGVYLQDHMSRGLTVRHGSHRQKSLKVGKKEYLKTHKGDVIFFDIRLTHAGQFADPVEYALLRAGRFLQREEVAMKLRAWYNKMLARPDKLSLFFTYGHPSKDTYAFMAYQRKESSKDDAEKASPTARKPPLTSA